MNSNKLYFIVFLAVTCLNFIFALTFSNIFLIIVVSILMYMFFYICIGEAFVKPLVEENLIWALIFYACICMLTYIFVKYFGIGELEPQIKVFSCYWFVTFGLGHMASFHKRGVNLEIELKDKILQIVILISFALSFYVGSIFLSILLFVSLYLRHIIAVKLLGNEVEMRFLFLFVFAITATYSSQVLDKFENVEIINMVVAFIAMSTFANLLSFCIDNLKLIERKS